MTARTLIAALVMGIGTAGFAGTVAEWQFVENLARPGIIADRSGHGYVMRFEGDPARMKCATIDGRSRLWNVLFTRQETGHDAEVRFEVELDRGRHPPPTSCARVRSEKREPPTGKPWASIPRSARAWCVAANVKFPRARSGHLPLRFRRG